MAEYNKEEFLTSVQVLEGKEFSEEQRSRFLERQEKLKAEMNTRAQEAMRTVWKNPQKLSDLLGVMEHFSREGTKFGDGFDNALCIYQKFGTSATCLIPSLDTEENHWFKQKGTTAVNILIREKGEKKSYRTVIKAFDISQMQEENIPGFKAIGQSSATPQQLMKAITAMQHHWNFRATHSKEIVDSVFVPSENGEPAQLILSDSLGADKQRLVQETAYCFSHLVMSFKQGYAANPETDFIARCSADFVCRRYGYQPRLVEAFPESVKTIGQFKELLSAVNTTAKTSAHMLSELLDVDRSRHKQKAAEPTSKGKEVSI